MLDSFMVNGLVRDEYVLMMVWFIILPTFVAITYMGSSLIDWKNGHNYRKF